MEVAEEFYSSYVVNCLFNAFLCYTNIVLNIITMLVIRKTSSLPKPLKTLLLSLAVSDLGVGLLVQPCYISLLVTKLEQQTESADESKQIKQLFVIMVNLFSWSSFFGVTALSLDRFLAIHLHLRYQELVTNKRVVAGVISIWVISILFLLLRLWTPENIIFVMFGIIDAASYITTAFLNYKIYRTVRQHQTQIQNLQVQQLAQDTTAGIANNGRQAKSAMAVVYIYIVFLVCYLPNTCMFWATALTDEPLNVMLRTYFMTLIFFNSSLNPLIYCWKMRHIRNAVMNMLRNALSKIIFAKPQ